MGCSGHLPRGGYPESRSVARTRCIRLRETEKRQVVFVFIHTLRVYIYTFVRFILTQRTRVYNFVRIKIVGIPRFCGFGEIFSFFLPLSCFEIAHARAIRRDYNRIMYLRVHNNLRLDVYVMYNVVVRVWCIPCESNMRSLWLR